ncbi:alpha/beta hydrolase [[Actinomadura] parvosata]|uniref:alpha/beta hydrolase n=1 Tax=[Actinomadura] parvosata TaxID=1955412 RepID=UPI00406D2BA5
MAPGDQVGWWACGDGLECAKLAVPVDWGRPRGPRTEIDLARMPARDPARSLGPLVVSTGAGPTIQDARARPDGVSELARWFDVVLVGSRGIGDRGSAATVRCSVPQPDPRRLQLTPGADAWRRYARDNAAYDRSCRIAAGPAYAGLTSWQVAHDLDAVRAALGQPRLRYFGNGYGAVYGQAYLELFPRRVERMYLEGAPDHGQPSVGRRLIARARAAERQLAAFRDWCARRAGCPLAGDDALKVLDHLLTHAPLPTGQPAPAPLPGAPTGRPPLPGDPSRPTPPPGHQPGPAPLPGRPGGRVPPHGGQAERAPLFGSLTEQALLGGGSLVGAAGPARTASAREVVTGVLAGLAPQRWPELARALAAAEAGDAGPLAAMAAPAEPVAPATVARSLHCHDFMPAVPGYRRFLAMEARLRTIAPRVGWLTARDEVGRCLGIGSGPSWPPRPAHLGVRSAGTGPARVPKVLVGIGRLDVESPAWGAARVAARIPGAAVLWHGDGHGAYLMQGAAKLRATCLRTRVHDFLVNGTTPRARTRCPGELTAALR